MFQPGQSGNPQGRAKGSVNKNLAMLRDGAEQIIPMLIEKALAGDLEAARLIVERGVPKLKPVSPPEAITLPGGGLLEQVRTLLQQVASGEVSANAAKDMLRLMSSAVQLLDTTKQAGLRVEPAPVTGGSAYVRMLEEKRRERQKLLA